MFIQTEATPNPATLKFLPGRSVLADGTADFRDAARAPRASPLAERLFDIPGVTGVFFGYDFVTVTKSDGEWQHLKPAILGAIMEHFMSGAPVMHGRRGAGEHRTARSSSTRPTRRSSSPSRNCSRRACARRSPGRRRHHLPRLRERHRLPQHEGRLLRLPVLDGDAEARHPEPAAPLRAGSARGRSRLSHRSGGRMPSTTPARSFRSESPEPITAEGQG